MNRREALASLASVAAATGISVTPVTAEDVKGVEIVVVRAKSRMSMETADRLKALVGEVFKGTSLEGVRVMVLDSDLDIEFVRTKAENPGRRPIRNP